MYHWDVLATLHGDVIVCFIWDVTATSFERTEKRRYDVATTSCWRVTRKDTSNRKDKCKLWNVNCNERFMLKHLLCTCDLQAFNSSVQQSKWNPLAFRFSKHSGVETVWRYDLKLGYIMQGTDLVKKVKKNCERCRYFRKKAINIEMGPVSIHNLRITSAFCATQVDLHLWTIKCIFSSEQKRNNQNLACCLLLHVYFNHTN